MEVRSYFLKKRKLYMQNLTKERKQPPAVILQKSIFHNIFIRCLWLRIIRRSDYGVQFMNFTSQIFFNDINHGYRAAILKKSSLWLLPFYMAVATYCYYKKVRRTMRTAIVSYLLKRQSCYHIETSQLICSANQLTSFYMMTTSVFNELISVKEVIFITMITKEKLQVLPKRTLPSHNK